uniref:Putative La1-like peptide n=1 Tax=Superstitionia donensis TaxID=311983 RepID=A0A1V1WBW3_9SCOR
MKKLIFSLVLICIFFIAIEAYTYIAPQEPGSVDCTDELGVHHPLGEVWYNEERCERLVCQGYGNGLSITGSGCGIVSAPGCKLVKGSGSYPKCCPKPVCRKR